MPSIASQLGIPELNPAEEEAWAVAYRAEVRGKRKRIPSAFEVVITTLLERIRELERENEELRRLR